MEVSLLGAQGLPEGCLLSVRVGTTRRQGPAVPETLKLRFPRGFTGVDNFKVDVLAPVSSKTVELEGAGKYRVPVGSDPHCQVLLELAEIDRDAGPIPNIDKAFASSALPKGTIPSDGESPSASRRHRAALSARQYLDEHRLLGWAQTLFQDLIRSRPKDPWAFIDEQTRLAKKLAETERKQSPELDDEQPPADVAALTMPMKINRIAEGVLTLGKQLQDRMKELEEEAESGARRKENPAEALQEISEGLSALSRELALRVQQLEEGGLWIPMKKSWEHSAGSASSTRHPGSTLEAIAETPTEVAETPYSPTLASRSLRSSAPPTPALPPTLEWPEEEEACEAKAVAPPGMAAMSQQELQKDPDEVAAAEPKTMAQQLIEVLDKDGDGQLTREEVIQGMKAMDTDGDGVVSEEELQAAIAAAREAKAAQEADGNEPRAQEEQQLDVATPTPKAVAKQMFEVLDKDGEGLTADKLMETMASMDADGDGALTMEELQSGIAASQEAKAQQEAEEAAQRAQEEQAPISADALLGLDGDGDGTVSKGELVGGLQAMNEAEEEARKAQEKAEEDAKIEEGIKALDEDGDGIISKDEVMAVMDTLDKDGDGVVTKEELAQAPEEQKPLLEHLLEVMDKDGDGDLTKEEIEAGMAALDTDGDGVVSEEELRAGIDAAREAKAAQEAEEEAVRRAQEEAPAEPTLQEQLFEVLDKDGDGELTKEEIMEGMAAMDADGDGIVTEEELRAGIAAAQEAKAAQEAEEAARRAQEEAARQEKEAPLMQQLFEVLDKDGDGELTKEEIQEGMAAMDADGDGIVTEEELRAGIAAARGAKVAQEPEGAEQRAQEISEGMQALEQEGLALTQDVVMEKMLSFDKDGDGVVTKEEFQAGIEAIKQASRDSRTGSGIEDGMKALDQDGDGELTKDEVAAALEALDKDGDGVITREELEQAPEEQKPILEKLFDAMDADGDGELTKEEIEAGMAALDANGDGVITTENLQAVIEVAEEPTPAEASPLKAGEVSGILLGQDSGGATPSALMGSMLAFDKDGDGHVSKEEFKAGLLAMKESQEAEAAAPALVPRQASLLGQDSGGATPSALMDSMLAFDKDGDGHVSKEEFKAGMFAMKESQEAELAASAPTSPEGEPTPKAMLPASVPTSPEAEQAPKDMLQGMLAWDTDGDGTVSKEEFAAGMMAMKASMESEIAQPSVDGRQAPPPADDAATTLADTLGYSDADAGANYLLMCKERGGAPSSAVSVSDADAAGNESRAHGETQQLGTTLATIQASQDSRLEEQAAALDQDGDGVVTSEDVADALAALDKDGDGVITREELEQAPEEQRPILEKLFDAMDADGDGELTREEIQAGLAALDADGDGVVTTEELKELIPQEAVSESEPEPQVPETPKAGITGFDQDGDGQITQKEVNTAMAALDEDGDGVISKEEMAEAAPAEEKTLQEQLFEVLDKDGDGELTREEIMEGMAAMDADGDGIVTEEELRAGIAAAQEAKAAKEAEEAAQRRALQASEAEPEPSLPDTPVLPKPMIGGDGVAKSAPPRVGTPQEPEAEAQVDKEYSGKEALLPEALRSGTSTAAPATGSLEPHTVESFLDGSRPGTGSTPAHRPGDLSEIDVLRSSVREPELDITKSGQEEGMALPRHAMELGRIHRQAQFEIQELRRYTREAKTDISDLHKNVRDEMKDLRGYAREARNDIFDLREQAEKVRDLLKMS